MSRLSSGLRALVNTSFPQLPVSQLTSCSFGTFREQLGGCTGGLWAACASTSAGVRHLARGATDRENTQSPTANADGNSGPASARVSLSLKDLLQASSQRIAQGEVSRLADVDGDAAAAAAEAAVQRDLQERLAAAPAGAEAAARHERAAAELLSASSQDPAAVDVSGGGGDGGASNAVQQLEQQQPRLLHPKYGYAALGGVVPMAEDAAAGTTDIVGLITAQHPRVNPRRKFMPGETYEPQDLNPFAARSMETKRRTGAVPRPSAAEVLEKADYKNVAFLTRWFLSPAGRLLPRRQTRLPVHVHKHVSRQIKLARHMGLIAGEARLDKMHLPRLRERELEEAQRRATEGGAGSGGGGAPRYNELLDFGA